MIYLASPYSHPDPLVMQARYEAACKTCAALMKAGTVVFSPVVASHPIVKHGLPTDWEFWSRFDIAFLQVAEVVAVLTLDGWQQSKGVLAEMKIAKDSNKPVIYINPMEAES